MKTFQTVPGTISKPSADRLAALYEIVAEICAENGKVDEIELTFQRLRAAYLECLKKRWISISKRTPVVFYVNKFGKFEFRLGDKYLPENQSETREAILGWGWKEVAVLDTITAYSFVVTEHADNGAPSPDDLEARLSEIRERYATTAPVEEEEEEEEETTSAPAIDAVEIVETFRAKHNLTGDLATFDALRAAVRKTRTFANFAVVTSDKKNGIHWKIVASRATLEKESKKNAYIGALVLRDLGAIA